MFNDTIVAISTPIGQGGISIVKISGSLSIPILKKIFKKKKGNFFSKESHSIHYGHIISSTTQKLIDEVLVLIMKSPKTYTKEDIVEIHCHGGIICSQLVLKEVLQNNARIAEPGEFTKRAFLNGRIDLSQAEAILSLIKAKTEISLKIALKQLEGSLSQKINEIKNEIIEILALIEVSIDFSEEDIDFLSAYQIQEKIQKVKNKCKLLSKTFEQGKLFQEGLKISIIGQPNVGKSSILNSLLKKDRAIVSEYPGTTRDTIEESLNIKGIPITLVDTAGIRESNSIIEQKGVERTYKSINEADLILVVLDNSQLFNDEDKNIFQKIIDKKRIIVINKIDLSTMLDTDYFKNEMIVKISALTCQGMDDLEDLIVKQFLSENFNLEEVMITNLRHKCALEKTIYHLKSAFLLIEKNQGIEIISLELKESLNELGNIIGETSTEDILNHIFSNFCIGK
ncbi:MAG: tRNA uridine-5-carboxymethylaminomethyl(34) synthesis GTPase MnmE [bacterium]